jgi:hypothetical protein
VNAEPEFFIDHVPSAKMDDTCFEDECYIINKYGSPQAKQNSTELIKRLRQPEPTETPQHISNFLKPKPKYAAFKKPVPVMDAEQPFERKKGSYSNTQWKDIDENNYDNNSKNERI